MGLQIKEQSNTLLALLWLPTVFGLTCHDRAWAEERTSPSHFLFSLFAFYASKLLRRGLPTLCNNTFTAALNRNRSLVDARWGMCVCVAQMVSAEGNQSGSSASPSLVVDREFSCYSYVRYCHHW